MKGRVLIVDDDTALAEMLGIVLRGEGFETAAVADGDRAFSAFREFKPDLVLLDLMLPGRDGIDVARQIRAESGVPIVMLTAKSDTVDVVVGLESGADDYVIKPFKPKELVARVRARLRRADEPKPETLAIGDLTIDVAGHSVKRAGEPIALTPLEFDLLVALARKPWQVFTREVLLEQDRNLVQHQISMLLFIAFICGLGMLFFTKFMGAQMIAAFTGPKNLHMAHAANTYVQIRGFAWPALLVGMVAQSASLGMKDSWGPLKALVVASVVNGLGDILLCTVLGYGIAGAAWATMVSQVIAAFMMIDNLNRTGFSAFSVSVPSPNELLQIFELAAPVFITMTSKIAFYSLLTYFGTAMGTTTIAAHQVMIGVFCMCTVWGEPLSQTAQSFLPEFIYGVHQNLMKARMLLRSLLIIGACTGLVLGTIGTSVPWFLPYAFTSDHAVVGEMHKVLLPYFLALIVTPSTHGLEGTLLAGRDLRFLSISMSGCFIFGGLLLLLMSSMGFGLSSCWWALLGFQWARFSFASMRLSSPHGMLYSEKFNQHEIRRLKAA